MNALIFSETLTELLRQGRFTVCSPTKAEPALITVFYLTGDLICYADRDKLAQQPGLAGEHLQRVARVVADTRLPLRFIERVFAALGPVVSFVAMLGWDREAWLKWAIFGGVSVLSYLTRSAMARAVLRLLLLKLQKKLKR